MTKICLCRIITLNFWLNLTRKELNYGRSRTSFAAFQLHQAVERFYSTVLLVFTGYKGKRHNIEKLGRQASGYDTAFLKVFPRATKEQDERFKLLKKAYNKRKEILTISSI